MIAGLVVPCGNVIGGECRTWISEWICELCRDSDCLFHENRF